MGAVRLHRSPSFRRALVGAAAALTLAATLGAPRVAGAQEAQAFELERLRITPDGLGIIDVEWGDVLPSLELSLGLWATYEDDPLVLYREADGERVGSLVHGRVGGSLVGAIGLFGFLQLGVEVPLIVYQTRDEAQPAVSPMPLPELTGFGFGDVRFVPKLRIVRGVALQVGVTLPSGREAYRGSEEVGLAPELILSHRFGALRAAVNVGYRMREEQRYLNQTVDDEFNARLGLGLALGQRVELGVSAGGAVAADAPFDKDNQTALEGLGALSIRAGQRVTFMLGGGVGLHEGYGTPDWRAFASVRLGPSGDRDTDGDGLLDSEDLCPTQPEDKDGFEDLDGCPDPDNDGDGVLDVDDGAPNDPEDKDGFEDADGVPDPDNDGDGILDGDDKCPNEPEVVNGVNDTDGCPDVADSDKDGVPDDKDKCPNDPEDKDGFEDDDGCPDLDDDGDGVVDPSDRCPREKGPVENVGCPDADRDGDGVVDRQDNCPDEPGPAKNHGCKDKQLVSISGGQLVIVDSVYFKTNSDVIEKRSYKLLDNVAAVILSHPEAGVIRVEGHTDDRGSDESNLALSQRRADSVKRYLIDKGVPAERLDAKGFGETQPLKPNTTRKNRATNRRVVFVLVDIEGVGKGNSGPGSDTIDR